ncbi:methenyltetrahydromethanopterin cyclohydrolase [Trinickia caryophylli]|uniref:Methenyltetrahydromethanopterin cyclohydrolase n=1 Tax=Trinickia caryophylli TaxID=28094 RepID=A0A1X7E2V4_TRICW|nr:methenyltetrahydromethanopterin cyclohydrolase [Trinickia caryophylli]PMS14018.1 methenyltetrahydromethanopterin cyclohydrolase [Trinickia caryophylli]TRX17711.1 methenyltetrahydromethanopterin cyclohydrolase [Trinickia caryophylli]WQE11529.1 methenyltetrahydromethanopterin cyclohydrolase [Trinickia caryophylli]SMF26252.1 methenyltetrahydromethanopterin cyclohydrolase [Trinickia caryophylli]GLU32695.1 methenyltetrahydromethanopterin cyclohydrolase [Trinickia caryophylli]
MPLSPTPPEAGAAAPLSVNALSERLVQRLVDDAARLGVAATRTDGGTVLVDAGIDAPGGLEAGVLIARICMGGLGRVAVRTSVEAEPLWPTMIDVQTSSPVLACLASQYAGWSLAATKEQTGGKKFFSLGSGPARALAGKEPLFDELGYRDRHTRGALVLEVDRMPPQVVIDKVLGDCALAPGQLTIAVTPTHSIAGTVQVIARVVEVALHKTHVLGVDLGEIVAGAGCAPLPPPAPDGIEAMGRTNDAILYGGRVHLTVRHDAAAKRLAAELPASNSRDYGRPFAEIFASFNYDFYQIDAALFAPAQVWVSSLESGKTWHGGSLEYAVLQRHWNAAADRTE